MSDAKVIVQILHQIDVLISERVGNLIQAIKCLSQQFFCLVKLLAIEVVGPNLEVK